MRAYVMFIHTYTIRTHYNFTKGIILSEAKKCILLKNYPQPALKIMKNITQKIYEWIQYEQEN